MRVGNPRAWTGLRERDVAVRRAKDWRSGEYKGRKVRGVAVRGCKGKGDGFQRARKLFWGKARRKEGWEKSSGKKGQG